MTMGGMSFRIGVRNDVEGLDDFDIGGWEPALTAVGEFDVVPGADLVYDLDLRALVEDEEVFGGFG